MIFIPFLFYHPFPGLHHPLGQPNLAIWNPYPLTVPIPVLLALPLLSSTGAASALTFHLLPINQNFVGFPSLGIQHRSHHLSSFQPLFLLRLLSVPNQFLLYFSKVIHCSPQTFYPSLLSLITPNSKLVSYLTKNRGSRPNCPQLPISPQCPSFKFITFKFIFSFSLPWSEENMFLLRLKASSFTYALETPAFSGTLLYKYSLSLPYP